MCSYLFFLHKMMKRFFLFSILVFITPFFSFASKNINNIAFVDVQKIIDNSLAVKNIRKEVDIINNKLQVEFTEIENELKDLEKNILKEKDDISENEFKSKVMNFNERVSKTQKSTQDKKVKLEQAHAKAISHVNNVAMEIIKNFAQEKFLDAVLPSTQVLYASENLNITLEILSELNAKLEKVDLEY